MNSIFWCLDVQKPLSEQRRATTSYTETYELYRDLFEKYRIFVICCFCELYIYLYSSSPSTSSEQIRRKSVAAAPTLTSSTSPTFTYLSSSSSSATTSIAYRMKIDSFYFYFLFYETQTMFFFFSFQHHRRHHRQWRLETIELHRSATNLLVILFAEYIVDFYFLNIFDLGTTGLVRVSSNKVLLFSSCLWFWTSKIKIKSFTIGSTFDYGRRRRRTKRTSSRSWRETSIEKWLYIFRLRLISYFLFIYSSTKLSRAVGVAAGKGNQINAHNW